jgi:hypothetical protein
MPLSSGYSAVLLFLLCVEVLAQTTRQTAAACPNLNNTSASAEYRGQSANTVPGNVSKLPVRSLLYPGATTRIFVRYMPWFGDSRHRDVGYRSDDSRQVARQVADMLSRGIEGAIVDWYGRDSGLANQSTILLMQQAEQQGLKFAISSDAALLGDCHQPNCDPTAKLIVNLHYVAEHFASSPAYLHFDGRPALFFFGMEKDPIDWKRVRQALPKEVLFFFRNSGEFNDPEADGVYAWIAPETAGPQDPMALQYLQRFYSKARLSNKIAMGSAYKGFNDADAKWGKGRVIEQECGQTWLTTFAEVGRFFSSSHQLQALIIPTWNDYEEGTEIETGIDNCVDMKAAMGQDRIEWTLSGRENTLDHFSILARDASGWTDVTHVSATSRFIPLRDLPLPAGATALCVQAVGKPVLLNHASGPLPLSASDKK